MRIQAVFALSQDLRRKELSESSQSTKIRSRDAGLEMDEGTHFSTAWGLDLSLSLMPASARVWGAAVHPKELLHERLSSGREHTVKLLWSH